MVLLELITGTLTALATGASVYYYCSQDKIIKKQHKKLTKQNYLHERYYEISNAACKLSEGQVVYVYAKNPAQISAKSYDDSVQEVVGTYNIPTGSFKIVYDKTAYSVEFKSQDILKLVEEAGLTGNTDSYGIFIESGKRSKC